MKCKNLMAKALYDNVPESPEELAFRKGDILTVVEQNTGGLEGWWLCSLHGRQGIAPGNRLKLLVGPFQAPPPEVCPARPPEVYQVPPRTASSKVVTPIRVGQSYHYSPGPQTQTQQDLYDVPASHWQAVYDIPPGGRTQAVYDVPPASQPAVPLCPGRTSAALQEGNYDIPQPIKHKQEGVYDVPPPAVSKASHYNFPLSAEAPAPRRQNEGIYDVPPSRQDVYDVPRSLPTDVMDGVSRLSFSSTGSSMSTSSSSGAGSGSSSGSGPGPGSVLEGCLMLDVDTAVQKLHRLQQTLDVSVGALLSMAASPHWRTFPNEVRTELDRVRAALRDLVLFGRGAAANADGPADGGLQGKLRRLLGRLEDSQQILLQLGGCSPSGKQPHHRGGKTDDLDRFVMVSRTLPDDAKQLASTVGSNAELLFRRTHDDGLTKPFPVPFSPDKEHVDHSEKCVKSWMDDYDYVHLQGKEDFERQQEALATEKLKQLQMDQLTEQEQEVTKPVENDATLWISRFSDSAPPPSSDSTPLCARDRQLLAFYSEQCEQHFAALLGAIDAFFGCMRAGRPPRVFVAHGKEVILSAHKLVFIGDALSRQAAAARLADRAADSSNLLCYLLKTVVSATKTAALRYPDTAAMQDMVDRVTELSHRSQHFKEQLLHMAGL